MSQRLVVLAVLTTATLAGCSGGGDSGSSTEDDDAALGLPARVLPWGLTDCRFGVALVAAPAARIALLLPPGFRSISLAEVGMAGAPNPNNDGNFGMELFECASGIGADGQEIPGMVYSSYFTAVEPPGALAEDVTYHFVKWDVLVPDADRRALLLSYGVPARGGSVEFAQGRDDGNTALHSGSVTWEGRAAETFTGAAAVEQTDGSFVEFTQTPGGLAAWRTNFTWSGGGLGPQVVVPAAGGMAAEVLGTQPKMGVGFSGRASFVGGSISLPAQPAELPATQPTPTKPPRVR